MHGHGDCLFAFLSILDDLDEEPPELYWRLLAETWSRDEMPAQHEHLWRQLWGSRRPGREAAMAEDERSALAALPDPLRVYRGVGHAERIKGLSWTLGRDRAIWFAHRATSAEYAAFRAGVDLADDCRPLLVIGEVAHGDVLAYLDERQEQEVVADAVRILEAQELAV